MLGIKPPKINTDPLCLSAQAHKSPLTLSEHSAL